MRAIPEGSEARHDIVVTDAMTVDFEQADPRLGRLHPVYATYWLTKHAELAGRKLILPYLEDGEEGIGYQVGLTHLASALPGMRVEVTARLRSQEGNRVVADVRAVNELGDLVGEGTTTQVILSQVRLERSFERLRERWRLTRAQADEAGG